MILYGSYTSPFVRHCRIELLSAELDFDFVDTDYAASDVGSPTKRVPYLHDGDTQLTDSSSILMHLRQKQDLTFISDAAEMDHYMLAGTGLDTAINLFLLEREGQTPANNDYLARQSARVETTLSALNKYDYESSSSLNTAETRTACLLAWGLYRSRFAIDGLDSLSALLERANQWQPFIDTAPPA